jgi:hypothetical protein
LLRSVRATPQPVNEHAKKKNVLIWKSRVRSARLPKKLLKIRSMALRVGDTAPDFELPVRGKETVKLSTALQNGPVVLLTYILDFSPG